MRRLLALMLCLLCSGLALGQGTFLTRAGSGLVRHYNFEQSGIDYYPAGNPPDLEITFNQDPALATLTPDRGAYTFTKHGAPAQGSDSTFPAGPSGARGKNWYGGGINEWLDCSEAQGCSDFDTPTNMTICWDARPGLFASTRYLISKYEAAAGQLRSWSIYFLNNNITATISDNGESTAGHQTALTATNSWTAFSRTVGCFTWEYVGDGSSKMRIYPSGAATVSTDVANGPVFDNDEAVALFSTSRGISVFPGWQNHIAIWASKVGDATKTLTEAQCRRWIAGRWGTYNGVSEGITVVNATGNYEIILPRNSGSNYIQAMPPNSAAVISPVTGLAGIEGDPQIINRAWRWGAEAWAGAAGGGCTNYPTGWSPSCSVGDGTSDIAPVTSSVPEGGYAIAMTLTGTTSYAALYQHCDSDGVGQTLDIAVEHRCASGACSAKVQLYEYSDAVCTVAVTNSTILDIGVGSATWATQRVRFAGWNPATTNYKIRLAEAGDGSCSSHWDALMTQSSASGIAPSYARCGADSDADVTCNHTYVTDGNPVRANMPVTFIWKGFSAWAAGAITSGVQYFLANGVGGTADTFYCGFYNSTSYFQCIVKDAAGNNLASVTPNPLAWAADSLHTIKWWRSGLGGSDGQGGFVDATAFGSAGAGTGILTAWNSTFYLISLSNSSSGSSYTVLSDLLIYNRVLP